MISSKFIARCAVACALILMFVAYAATSIDTPMCVDDCVTYVVLMQMKGHAYFQTLLSMAWPWAIPTVKPWTVPILRPWAIPLFFSLFGQHSVASAAAIMKSQTVILFMSWVFFGYCCSTFVKSKWIRTIFFIAASLMMFGQGYQHSNPHLRSDSLAMSSVLIQLSLCLFFGRVTSWCDGRSNGTYILAAYVAALAISSAIEMTTRDANISLALAGVALTFFDGFGKREMGLKLIVAVIVLALAVPATVSAKMRHAANAENILVGIVLPNPEIRQFFVDNGMSPQLAKAGAGLPEQDLSRVGYQEMYDIQAGLRQLYLPFLPQFDGIYARYLALHPGFVIRTVAKYWRMIFDQWWGATTPNPLILGPSPRLSLADWLPLCFYPIFPMLYLVRADLRRRVGYWPVLLVLIGFGNAVLGFFGDVWTPSEMERHAFIGSVIMRAGVIVCLLFATDSAWTLADDGLDEDSAAGSTDSG